MLSNFYIKSNWIPLTLCCNNPALAVSVSPVWRWLDKPSVPGTTNRELCIQHWVLLLLHTKPCLAIMHRPALAGCLWWLGQAVGQGRITLLTLQFNNSLLPGSTVNRHHTHQSKLFEVILYFYFWYFKISWKQVDVFPLKNRFQASRWLYWFKLINGHKDKQRYFYSWTYYSLNFPSRTRKSLQYDIADNLKLIPVRCEERAETVGKEEVLPEDEVRVGTENPAGYLWSCSASNCKMAKYSVQWIRACKKRGHIRIFWT